MKSLSSALIESDTDLHTIKTPLSLIKEVEGLSVCDVLDNFNG